MLACYREILRDDAYVRSGQWEANGNAPLTRSADGQTVGILGLGRIGQAIAQKLSPWNSTIVYHTRTPKDVPYRYYDNLAEMAAACDVLICITPGGPATTASGQPGGAGRAWAFGNAHQCEPGLGCGRSRPDRRLAGGQAGLGPGLMCSRQNPRCRRRCAICPTRCCCPMWAAQPSRPGLRWATSR